MKRIQYTSSPGVPHQSMEDELLCHRRGSEWWYCTGFITDEDGKLYSFQFTLARVRLSMIQMHLLMTALTDFEARAHHYAQKPVFFARDVLITRDKVGLLGSAELAFHDSEISLRMNGSAYTLALEMYAEKSPVWHCDNGILKMGLDDPKETTYYWSYTNLAVSGKLRLGGREHVVSGKAWFDKQGGTYTLTKRWTNWEWFSLRFHDGEEVMLFSFPQDNYQDGTFIPATGSPRRLNDYRITALGFIEVGGRKFSCGWKVEMPGTKDREYTIIPKVDGQLNLFYFELLADIRDRQGRDVGYCVVELLPGVYNEIRVRDALTRAR
jgi:predicted secreted hydrolase